MSVPQPASSLFGAFSAAETQRQSPWLRPRTPQLLLASTANIHYCCAFISPGFQKIDYASFDICSLPVYRQFVLIGLRN